MERIGWYHLNQVINVNITKTDVLITLLWLLFHINTHIKINRLCILNSHNVTYQLYLIILDTKRLERKAARWCLLSNNNKKKGNITKIERNQHHALWYGVLRTKQFCGVSAPKVYNLNLNLRKHQITQNNWLVHFKKCWKR